MQASLRYSQAFIPTQKEVPSEAQIPSHQLMVRSGMVRQLAAGIYSFYPLGWRVAQKVMTIIREEMNAIGGMEFHLPALNPIEIWEQTNRVEAMGDVMFHIKNRPGLVLAPTHEEIITHHATQHIQSYKDMPQIWYQIQTKFRNEPRPRSGILRGRQFTMKDSYSMDTSWEGLDTSYEKHAQAYRNIYTRCGLKFFVVGASSGAMGGSKSQEFMVESEFGEDTCAITDAPHGGYVYAANIEAATSLIDPVGRRSEEVTIEEFATPNAKTIEELVTQFGLSADRCAKSVVYICDDKPVLSLMRGTDELNEAKLQSAVKAAQLRPATDTEIFELFGAHAGSLGPVNAPTSLRIIADSLLENANDLVSGANKDGFHYKNIDLTRDATIEFYTDLRTVQAGEPAPDGSGPLRMVKAIEIGHIFKLGTKYSIALNANFLDKDGKQHPIIMGSYGIGVERIMACFVEQHHDEHGIQWAPAIAPYHIHIILLGANKSETVRTTGEQMFADLSKQYDVLLDDRDTTAGVKFNDADLLGMPIQLVLGDKNLNNGNVEIKNRRTGERLIVPLADVPTALARIVSVDGE
jgi:prolyl-tRNA synthetase